MMNNESKTELPFLSIKSFNGAFDQTHWRTSICIHNPCKLGQRSIPLPIIPTKINKREKKSLKPKSNILGHFLREQKLEVITSLIIIYAFLLFPKQTKTIFSIYFNLIDLDLVPTLGFSIHIFFIFKSRSSIKTLEFHSRGMNYSSHFPINYNYIRYNSYATTNKGKRGYLCHHFTPSSIYFS